MVKLISFFKILILVVDNEVVKLNEIHQ